MTSISSSTNKAGRLITWKINVHHDIREMPQLVQQFMLHFSCDPVATFHREKWIDGA